MHSAARIWTYRAGMPTRNIAGYWVKATDGGIGNVDEATYADGTSYIVVATDRSIFDEKVVLPAGLVTHIDIDAETILVDRTKAEINDAPGFDEPRTPDDAYRNRLGGYYGYRDAAVYDEGSLGKPAVSTLF